MFDFPVKQGMFWGDKRLFWGKIRLFPAKLAAVL